MRMPVPAHSSTATIRRELAELEDGGAVQLYRTGDDRLLTYEELYDEVDAEGSALPPEQWIYGEWNCRDYIIEACLVGIYSTEETLAAVVSRENGETVVEYTGENGEVVAERLVAQE